MYAANNSFLNLLRFVKQERVYIQQIENLSIPLLQGKCSLAVLVLLNLSASECLF